MELPRVLGTIWKAVEAATSSGEDKGVATGHSLGNVVVVPLFVASFYFRWNGPTNVSTIGYMCSFVGFGIALFYRMAGRRIGCRLGIGVDNGANLDGPSSLRTRSAVTDRPPGNLTSPHRNTEPDYRFT